MVVEAVCVSVTKSTLVEEYGSDWVDLGGLDSGSTVVRAGEHVLKMRKLSPFWAGRATRTAELVAETLGSDGVVPTLIRVIYDGFTLALVYEYVAPRQISPSAQEAGQLLARVHGLTDVPPPVPSHPWVGFYGGVSEMKFVLPSIEDDYLRDACLKLLESAGGAALPRDLALCHRDFRPSNLLVSPSGSCMAVDWDMSHVGYASEDLGMSALVWAAESEVPVRSYFEFIEAYRASSLKEVRLSDEELRSSVALAALRQVVSAWFSDEGRSSAAYWPNVSKRLELALRLLPAEGLRPYS